MYSFSGCLCNSCLLSDLHSRNRHSTPRSWYPDPLLATVKIFNKSLPPSIIKKIPPNLSGDLYNGRIFSTDISSSLMNLDCVQSTTITKSKPKQWQKAPASWHPGLMKVPDAFIVKWGKSRRSPFGVKEGVQNDVTYKKGLVCPCWFWKRRKSCADRRATSPKAECSPLHIRPSNKVRNSGINLKILEVLPSLGLVGRLRNLWKPHPVTKFLCSTEL